MDENDGFDAYMAARWPTLVRSLILLGCAPAEAEDVVQTGLVRCLTSWERVQRADDVDAYVYRVVLNCWAKSRRRLWWGEQPTEHLPDQVGGDPADQALLRHAVVAALSRLSTEHRAVLVLRFVADLTEAQTATALGIPLGTVKSRVSRALDQIQLNDLREEEQS
ncbi:SigE family RNA polymerase sigma factor [Nocardioides humilatus]|uniref:SigE family RNA polymerase sigma factor n=1 Tax=Nocardioides humilatus TaxID=2607660 RepID=A0A5B1L794_9ACTN|nr:SigE family RNA polymerase sigma factor [Nocardioides humilatus]